MKRTTIMADEETLYALSRIARQKGESTSSVIREALAEYVERHQSPEERIIPLFKLVALGASGQRDVSARVAEIVMAEAHSVYGLSVHDQDSDGYDDSD